MNLESHENKIKSKLSAWEKSTDIDALWDVIEPTLEKKKDRKFLLLLFLFAGLSICLSSIYLFNQESSILNIANNNIDVVDRAENSKTTKEAHTNNKKSEIKEPTINQSSSKKSHVSKVIPSIHLTSKNINNETRPVNSNNPQIKYIKKEKEVILNDLKINNINKKNEVVSKIQISKEKNKNNIIEAGSLREEKMSIFKNNNISEIEKQLSKLNTKNTSKNKTVADVNDNILEQISKLSINSLKCDDNKDLKPIQLTRSKKNSFSIAIGFNYGIYDTKKTALSEEHKAYLSKIEKSVSEIEFQKLNLMLLYQISPKFSVIGGLELSHLVNRINLKNVVEIDTMIQGVRQIYYRTTGTETETDLIHATKKVSQHVQWHSFKHMADFTLSMRYKLLSRNLFSIHLEPGIKVNILQKSKGAFLTEDERIETYGTNANLFQATTRLSYFNRIHFDYQIKPSQKIFLNLDYNSGPKRLAKYSQNIVEKDQLLSIGFGIQFKL